MIHHDAPFSLTALQRALIRTMAFLCGAVVMSFEILGSRLLAPNFGSSIYVWGSLISVFLAGLTCGYYLGGRVADNAPTPGKLGLVALGTSGILLGTTLLHDPLSDLIFSLNLDVRYGALVNALALFFVPSLLLGMVSPYATRLLMRGRDSSGRTVGSLYALSTLGSIAGTLLTSFYLITLAGVQALLVWHGLVLGAASVCLVYVGRSAGTLGIVAKAPVKGTMKTADNGST